MDLSTQLNILQNSENASDRLKAAEDIYYKGKCTQGAINAFAHALKDQDRGVRDICSRALMNVCPEMAHVAAEAISELITIGNIEIRNLAGDILLKLGQYAVNSLLPYLADSDMDVRKYACDIIGLSAGEEEVEYIIPLLSDEDQNCVASAIEALGNIGSTESVSSIIELYQKSEDFRPNIIDALGKIGGEEAQSFLISIIRSDQESFTKFAAIDALAYSGDDISLCFELMSELENINRELQPIILKTIFAISFRLEQEIELPLEFRYIAHNALMDEDGEIRGAGLAALGESFRMEDISSLLHEVSHNDPDTQQHIIGVLAVNCTQDVITSFFNAYFSGDTPDGSEVEFVGLLSEFWHDLPSENLDILVNSILNAALAYPKGSTSAVIELIRKFDSERLDGMLSSILQGNNIQYKREVLDLISQLGIYSLKDDLDKLAEEENDLGSYAREILQELI